MPFLACVCECYYAAGMLVEKKLDALTQSLANDSVLSVIA